MDVSATCNLACRDCYTKRSHTPQLMDKDRFGAAMGKFASSGVCIEKLHLNWRGEPLVNKSLVRLLEMKRAMLPNAPLEFHTNGMLLNDELSEQLIQVTAADDQIYVSIDGGNRLLHESNRGTMTWCAALDGLRSLLDARDGAPHPPSIGIYEITFGRAAYDPDLLKLARRCDVWTKVAPISCEGDEAHFRMDLIPNGPCFWVGNTMCITAAGDVHVCLLSFRDDGIIGNIFVDDFSAIIQRAQEFRRTIEREGRQRVAHCRGCLKTEGSVDP